MENIKETGEERNNQANPHGNGHGPKYFIDIEGTLYPWDEDTITTEQIIVLGGLNPADGVIEVDVKEGTETTLQPGQVITIKPGQGFSKKIKFKRGI